MLSGIGGGERPLHGGRLLACAAFLTHLIWPTYQRRRPSWSASSAEFSRFVLLDKVDVLFGSRSAAAKLRRSAVKRGRHRMISRSVKPLPMRLVPVRSSPRPSESSRPLCPN